MANCPYCGSNIPVGTETCPSCGAMLGAQPAAQQPVQQNYQQPVQQDYQQPAQQNYQQQNYQQPVQQGGQYTPVNQQYYNPMPTPVATGGLLAWSIVTILLCTIPGVIALINTININKAQTVDEQMAKMKSARMWCIIGTVLGILSLIGTAASRGMIG